MKPFAAVALVLCACGGQATQQPNLAAAGCVSHRTAKELECVDLNPDKPTIDACRAKVQAEIDCAKDGGTHD